MLIACADARCTQTPNATMRTLAAPSVGSTELSVWEVSMAAGRQGPRHEMDREQVWVVLAGDMVVEVGDQTLDATAGDAVLLASGVSRRIKASTDMRALVTSAAGPHVTTAERGTMPLPWAS